MFDVILALLLLASLYVVCRVIGYAVASAWCYLDRYVDRQRAARCYGVETALFEIDTIAESAWHRWEAEKVEESEG